LPAALDQGLGLIRRQALRRPTIEVGAMLLS
jgi:hypothetical protein